MAETTDVNVAKNINEAAVKQLIDHIMLDYTPDATVDPSSDGPVSGKAVYNFMQSESGKEGYFVLTNESDASQEDLVIDIPDTYSYTLNLKLGENIKQAKALDVVFGFSQHAYDKYCAPLFAGQKFTLINLSSIGNPPTYQCRLVWMSSGLTNEDYDPHQRVRFFERNVKWLAGKLTISKFGTNVAQKYGTGKTIIGNPDENTRVDLTQTVTQEQAESCIIPWVTIIKRT